MAVPGGPGRLPGAAIGAPRRRLPAAGLTAALAYVVTCAALALGLALQAPWLGLALKPAAAGVVVQSGQGPAAGVEAGTYIADQLIDGGSTTIEQTNALVASLESVADTLGIEGADKFYAAGVAQGEALVAGIQSVIDNYNTMLANPNLTLPQIKAIGASADAALSDVINGPTAPAFDVGQFQQNRLGDQYNITVYGGLNSSAEQGRAVIDAIKAANRADGPADILVR